MMRLFAAVVILILSHLVVMNYSFGDSKFISSYPCSDTGKYCSGGGGMRKIDGFEVRRDCWEYSYKKTYRYPSRNDCSKHYRCYSLGQRDCLLRDSLGNCVNLKKEFSCKRHVPTYVESETVRYGLKEKEGPEGLVCKGIPCIDGNCIDKSYEMDEEMVSSISQLGALAQGKNTDAGFKLFEAVASHCSKKPVGYLNCCRVEPKGWGQQLKSKCSPAEKVLSDKRTQNLCVYVGKSSSKSAGVTTETKHHFCCFANLIEKTVQVQAREQLGISFGSGGSPNCRGLTLEELNRVDFSKMDFSEVAAEVHKKMVMPDIADIEARVKGSFSGTNKFDDNHPADIRNKAAGVNSKVRAE